MIYKHVGLKYVFFLILIFFYLSHTSYQTFFLTQNYEFFYYYKKINNFYHNSLMCQTLIGCLLLSQGPTTFFFFFFFPPITVNHMSELWQKLCIFLWYQIFCKIIIVGIRAQDHILGLELSPRMLNGPRRNKQSLGIPI